MPIPAGSGSPTNVVDFDELRVHLGFKNSNNDVELHRFLNVAESAVSLKVGPLIPVTVTERASGGHDCLVLKRPRAISVSGVTYTDGTVVDPTLLDLSHEAGLLYLTTGCFPRGRRNVTVTYLAGWSSVPPDVIHAIKELVRHLWETQRPNALSNRPGSIDDAPVTVGPYGTWPPRVQELLDPYIPVMVA